MAKQDSFDDVAPDASAMIESMRAHGYTLPSAIADLVDNSIAAESRHIWVKFKWDAESPWISVTDDGHGMTETALVNAMRLGSQSPVEQRALTDLGRFGLGLKTASFSQARRLTVRTRRHPSRTYTRRWDLDHLARPEIKGWQLLKTLHPDTGNRAKDLDRRTLMHGTQVLLEVLDRLTGQRFSDQREEDRRDHFLAEIERVRAHLAMVFQRFLARRRQKLHIMVNDHPILPWDPFLEKHRATQALPEASHQLPGRPPITAQGFVLPHIDKFAGDRKAHEKAGGPAGWNAQQGFYLYRANRLIIAGDWLQLNWQKEEHLKLARIRLDIPNSMDHEWQIDVKKSTASPPPVLRKWLKKIATDVRARAGKVYRHRGEYRPRGTVGPPPQRPWKTVRRGEDYCYKIVRQHPLLDPLVRSLSTSRKKELETLLRLVEETVPVETIWIDKAENVEGATQPFATMSAVRLREVIVECHRAMTNAGKSAKDAWELIEKSGTFQTDAALEVIGQLRTEAS